MEHNAWKCFYSLRNLLVSKVLAYADDIDIIGQNILSIKRTFGNLEKEAQNMGLRINVTKTKYMHMSRRLRRNLQRFLVESYAFEEVSECKYLGALVSAQGATSDNVRASPESKTPGNVFTPYAVFSFQKC